MQQRLDLARRAQEAAAKQLAAVAASRRRMQLRHIAQRLAADAASCGADGNKRAGAVGARWRDHQDGYAAPLGQQLSRSSCDDGRWVRGSGGDDGARGGHGAGGCRGRAGAARRRQREVKRASVERRLRIAPAASDRTSGFGSPQQRHLSKLDLNWVTFFVNRGKPHRGRKFSQAVGGAALDLRITPV